MSWIIFLILAAFKNVDKTYVHCVQRNITICQYLVEKGASFDVEVTSNTHLKRDSYKLDLVFV